MPPDDATEPDKAPQARNWKLRLTACTYWPCGALYWAISRQAYCSHDCQRLAKQVRRTAARQEHLLTTEGKSRGHSRAINTYRKGWCDCYDAMVAAGLDKDRTPMPVIPDRLRMPKTLILTDDGDIVDPYPSTD